MAGYGLRLVRTPGVEGFTGNLNEYDISPPYTSKMHTGDPVTFASGYINRAVTADSVNFEIAGVFAGCRYTDSDGSIKFKPYWDGVASRTNIKAMVIAPFAAMFWIKGETGQTYTQADIGTQMGVNYAAGNDTYGDSRITLSNASSAASTGPLFVHRLADLPGMTIGQDEPVFEVSIVRPIGFEALT